MTYEISALIFSLLTGYVSAKYEGKIISRVSVFMLLTAAGGFLASTIWEEENLLGSLICENRQTPFCKLMALGGFGGRSAIRQSFFLHCRPPITEPARSA